MGDNKTRNPSQYQINRLLGIEYRQSNTGESFSEWRRNNGYVPKRGRPKKNDN